MKNKLFRLKRFLFALQTQKGIMEDKNSYFEKRERKQLSLERYQKGNNLVIYAQAKPSKFFMQ